MNVARLCVVIVSDYEGREEKTWESERLALAAFDRQDIAEPFDVLVIESSLFRGSEPADLTAGRLRVRVLYADETASARLKDFGVRQTDATFVAVVEADCVPDPAWLRVLVSALREHPECCVVSGRTSYGDESSYHRVLGLLDRSFDDWMHPGSTDQISNNGAIFRRDVLLRFEYPDSASPFSSARVRMEQMRAAGLRFWFEPAAGMHHAIGGFGFIRDFRRHTGFNAMAAVPDPGPSDVPSLWCRRRLFESRNMLRCRSRIRWFDLPLLLLIAPLASLLEIPGMLDAINERPAIPGTEYR